MAQAAAAQGSMSSAAGGRPQSERRRSGARAHDSSVSSAAGGRARGGGGGKAHSVGPQLLLHRPRWMTGVGGGPANVHQQWKLWLLGAKDELLLPRRVAYQVSSTTDGGSL
jgi:hypothetical protein